MPLNLGTFIKGNFVNKIIKRARYLRDQKTAAYNTNKVSKIYCIGYA
ncbi:hypothetical protein SDC9_101096 [bioreactor metagenome]|uniref:Uncharacterized protein n=1 Tax=bioreactor metagenome TaxID=1076179 RepID=A0A645ANH4_9ZZZZ